MDKNRINKIIKDGAKTSVDKKNTQPRQVVASSGKLRIQVGAPNGAKNN